VEAEQIAACEKVESRRSAVKKGEGEGVVERIYTKNGYHFDIRFF
jgi:hypothetical protein